MTAVNETSKIQAFGEMNNGSSLTWKMLESIDPYAAQLARKLAIQYGYNSDGI